MSIKGKKILIVIMSIVVAIIIVLTIYSKFTRDSYYNNLLRKAEKCMSNNDFNNAKSLYSEASSVKGSNDIDDKFKEIDAIEASLNKISDASQLVSDKKFDEAIKVVDSIENKSTYISEKTNLIRDEIAKGKEEKD